MLPLGSSFIAKASVVGAEISKRFGPDTTSCRTDGSLGPISRPTRPRIPSTPVTATRPPAADQRALLDDPTAARAARLREAIRQTRAVAGPDAALRVLEVDPDSRFPERRMVLAPFEG